MKNMSAVLQKFHKENPKIFRITAALNVPWQNESFITSVAVFITNLLRRLNKS